MNYETIKTFGAEARMVGQYDVALQTYARAAVQANTSLQLLNGIQSVVLNIGLVSVTLLAGMEVLHGRMSLGGVTACILILQQVYAPLFSLGMNYREIRQAFIDMEQMLELMAIDARDRRRPAPPAPCRRRGAGARNCASRGSASSTPRARSAWTTWTSSPRPEPPRRWSGPPGRARRPWCASPCA